MERIDYLIRFFEGISNDYEILCEGDIMKSTTGKSRDAIYYRGRIYRLPKDFDGTAEEYRGLLKKIHSKSK